MILICQLVHSILIFSVKISKYNKCVPEETPKEKNAALKHKYLIMRKCVHQETLISILILALGFMNKDSATLTVENIKIIVEMSMISHDALLNTIADLLTFLNCCAKRILLSDASYD